MRRKYDLRNKRNFAIILVLAILVVCVFSLFIYKYLHASSIEYKVSMGAILQDDNKNFINVESDSLLKIRWNDNYYLEHEEEKVSLGKRVIIYDELNDKLKLYGKFYEIDKTGKIIENIDETILNSTNKARFYKLDDRKYLLIDKQIVSDDRSIEASHYMLVELDKMGNAKLSNNKLNLKTISPTILVTSEYTFDIANEILKYAGKNIDLKKIIGSTNQYVPETEGSNEEKNTNGGENENNGEGNSNFNNGNNSNETWNGSGIGGSGTVINNNDTGDVNDIGEIKNKTKMTSIVRVQEGLSQIDVDYVIYDPYNEYKSVYAEIIKSGQVDVVYLSKNDTHIVFDKLSPNTEYKINFIYTTAKDDTGEIIPTTFESLNLMTKMPQYSINVYRVSNVSNKLVYRVYLQEGYSINKVNVSLSFKHFVRNDETDDTSLIDEKLTSSVSVTGNPKYVDGTIELGNYNIDRNSLLILSVDSVNGNNGELRVESTYTFRLGR